MLPPSRGSANGGAFAPSARLRPTVLRGLVVACFEGPTAGFGAALVFPICGFLMDFAAVDFRDDGLDDFFRVSLDIRLPFVAFRGTIIAVLRQTGIGLAAPPVAPARIMLKTISTRHLLARKACGFWPADEQREVTVAA